MSTTTTPNTVPVPSVEEVPRISDAERKDLIASLEQGRADIAAGNCDVLTPGTLRKEFDAILEHGFTRGCRNVLGSLQTLFFDPEGSPQGLVFSIYSGGITTDVDARHMSITLPSLRLGPFEAMSNIFFMTGPCIRDQ